MRVATRGLYISLTLVVLGVVLKPACVKGQTSGMKITIKQKLLQTINDVVTEKLAENLAQIKLADIQDSSGDLQSSITGIHISNLGTLTSSIDLRKDHFAYSASLSTIQVEADWRFRWDTGFLGITLSDSGSVTVSVHNTEVSLTVTPGVESDDLHIVLESCSASVGELDVDFSDSALSGVYDLAADLFKKDLKGLLVKAVCDSVQRTISKLATDLTRLQTRLPVHFVDMDLAIDIGFSRVTVDDDSFTLYQKGSIIWAGTEYYPEMEPSIPYLPELGLAIDISLDAFNNVLRSAVQTGTLNQVLDDLWQPLPISCSSGVCIGTILKQVKELYPDRDVVLQTDVRQLELWLNGDTLTVSMHGRVKFTADIETYSDPLFSASVDIDIPLYVRFFNGTLSTKIASISGNMTIDESSIGKVLNPTLQDLAVHFSDLLLSDYILPAILDQEASFKFRLPNDLVFQRTNLVIRNETIRVETDICYMGYNGCTHETSANPWVGTAGINRLRLTDTIPPTTIPPTAAVKSDVINGSSDMKVFYTNGYIIMYIALIMWNNI